MIGVVDSDKGTDFVDGIVRRGEQALCLLNADAVEILKRGNTKRGGKVTAQLIFADAGLGGERVKRMRVFVILLVDLPDRAHMGRKLFGAGFGGSGICRVREDCVEDGVYVQRGVCVRCAQQRSHGRKQ